MAIWVGCRTIAEKILQGVFRGSFETRIYEREEITMKVRIRMTRGKRLLPWLLAVLFLPATSALADAEANYKAKCAGCHGADGAGSTPAGKAMKARDFHSPEVQKETDMELTDIIANGKNKMPKYADKLKEAEIKELTAYVRALGKK
jgi:mono/diheme cytochrome c family protein